MADEHKPSPAAPVSGSSPQAGPTQLGLPGVPPGVGPAQPRFFAAAQYASLALQVGTSLFPGQSFVALTPDQRRIVDNETKLLLLQSRWSVESNSFAEYFASPPPSGWEAAPPGTALGEHPAAAAPGTANPGQYL